MISTEEILMLKKSELGIYSPYSFIRNVDKIFMTKETVINPVIAGINTGAYKVYDITVNNKVHYFIVKKLEWDSRYFGFPVYYIHLVLCDHEDLVNLNSAIEAFAVKHIEKGAYWFVNVPSDDLLLVQALCSTRFRLVETRLNYYLSNLQTYTAEHYPTRLAELGDSQDLSWISIKMRNRFDRVHADPAFTMEQADAYLGTFAEESIKGFADYVIIPDVAGLRPFGFLAGNKPKEILGFKVSKLVLAAVDSSQQSGWLSRLLSAMILKVKEDKADFLTTITQAANKPAINVWEKAGFKLSSVSHIFSTFTK